MEFEDKLRDRSQWAIGDECSMVKVLDLLSTKTAFLVVRECFYGTTRFEEFMERSGASAPALSRALKALEAAQILTRVPYQEPGQRLRHEYRLTAAGEDLLPVFLALVQWGDKYLQANGGPLCFVDMETGREVGVGVADVADGSPIAAGDIEIRLGDRYRAQALK
jgi:DNA-binding HxlR family transcriptional regulator